MWKRALMRLFGLSFMSIFVVGLLWEESRRRDETADPVSPRRKKERTR
jgi:hypothetical protein